MSDDQMLDARRRELQDTPTDQILDLAFRYGVAYPDRVDKNLYETVWAEHLAAGKD